MKSTSTDRRIAIGVIGPEPLVRKIQHVLQRFPSFRPIPKIYGSHEEAPALAGELAGEAEVLLLSGPVPYWKVREGTEWSIPVHYVPLTDTDLFRALHRLRSVHGLPSPRRLSIDSLSLRMVEGAFKEIGEPAPELLEYDGLPDSSLREYVEFHARHAGEGKSGSAALTAEPAVADALAARGIPCECVLPTDTNIIVALERALLSTETRQSKESQIVVGLMNVDKFEKHVRHHASEHDVQKLKLDIHRALLDSVESLDGYLTNLGGDEYLFFTTRGIFERETGGYKFIPIARAAKKKFGLTLSIGIGFGLSANEAGTNARMALRRAKEAGGNACFILREDRTLIGPLETTEPMEKALALADPELIKKAEDAGISSAYMVKLMNQAARTGRIEYNVLELANLLDITVRSMHRLLIQWADGGLVEIAGMEKVPRGRPRQIFRLTFLS